MGHWRIKKGLAVSVLQFVAEGNAISKMKTLTVKLPDELAVRLEKRAKHLGVSQSELVRESVERGLSDACARLDAPSMYDLTREDCGCFDSGLTDLATNPKHMEGFGR